MYLYKCPVCGGKREVMLKIAELDSPVPCLHDDFPMNRQVTAPYVQGDLQGYDCPVSGKWIEGRKAHEDNLKRTGCRLLEPGESNNFRQSQRQDEEKMLDKIGETAERLVHQMDSSSRDKLVGELQGGMGLGVERSSPKF